MPPPLKLTEDIEKRLCQALGVGASLKIAAHHAGISEATFQRWRAKGKAAKTGRWFDFHEKIQTSKARCAMGCLVEIQKAAKYDWKAAAWLLARRYRETYGSDAKVEIHTDGKPFLSRAKLLQLVHDMPDEALSLIEDTIKDPASKALH